MSPTSIGVNLRVTGHCSQGGRKYMEDFFSVAYQQSEDQKDLEYAFFGIYDGHGGSEAATFAKEHLMNAIVNQKLFWSDCDQDVLRAIREGYIATHYAMWREQEKWPKTATGLPSTAGTTASVAFIRRGKIYIGHVGDSGIVLGYQESGEKYWRAKPLTHDHKPECNVEKARIMNSGGKVVTKSGVPRVVWNRPRIGHKGPVRRSTPIDEIPFLAVARSLGDLWSYNSALNEFVVSPDPDVRVVKIDPKTFRCLIFGTDGLWNVLSASDAMNLARDAEAINERLGYMGASSEWTNPSKCLVEKALEKWNIRKMRADNTSVVTIMLDPPGPPKREALIRNCPSASCSVDYIQMDGLTARSENSNSFTQNFLPIHNDLALYDQSMRDHHHQAENSSQDAFDKYLPSSGYAVMTRYDNNYDSNYLYYGNHPEMMLSSPPSPSTTNAVVQQDSVVANSLTHEIQYMDSFAESYNSLLISSYASDNENAQNNICNSDTSDNEARDIDMRIDYHSYQSLEETGLAGHDHVHHHQPNSYNQQQQHLYQQQCMSAEDGYSLTKLETRGEQQFNSIQSYRQQQQQPNVSFQEFGEEHSYSQYDVSCSYQQPIASPTRGPTISHQFDEQISVSDDKTGNNSIQLIAPQSVMNKYLEDSSYYEPNLVLSDESEKAWLEHTHEPSENRINLDESIQINEVSSSMIETSPSSMMTEEDDFEKSTEIAKQNDDIQMTTIKPMTRIASKERSSKSDKSTSNKYKANKYSIEQNENISVLERRQLRSSVDYNKRTLRSRNSLTKDMKTRSTKQQQQQNYQLRRMAINHFSAGPCTKLRSRQIQQQHITIWQPKQNRKSTTKLQQTSGAQCDTVTSKSNLKMKQSLVCSKPKTSVSINSNKLQSKTLSSTSSSSQSCVATSSVSSTTMSKRSTSSRNSAWCPGKTAVQTRNRVQKRLSH